MTRLALMAFLVAGALVVGVRMVDDDAGRRLAAVLITGELAR